MHALVVVAHPRPESLTQALARAYCEGLAEAGHSVDLLDLYSEGFDALLTAAELERPSGFAPPPAVRAGQERLARAGLLALVYPVWWGTPPAILQGWLQRVMSYDFGFRYEGGRPVGLLGQKVQLILNAGGPPEGRGERYLGPLEAAFRFCGVRDIRALVNWKISPGTPAEAREAALAAAREAGRGAGGPGA